MKNAFLYLAAVLIIAVLSSCSIGQLFDQFNAAPTAQLEPNKGRVVGTLLVRSGGSTQPVSGFNVYLAATVKDITGKDAFVGLERVNAPRAITDAQGTFIFQNIVPGNYGLVLDIGFDTILMLKPESEEGIILTVMPGKEVSLGTLLYESLPLPPRPQRPPYP